MSVKSPVSVSALMAALMATLMPGSMAASSPDLALDRLIQRSRSVPTIVSGSNGDAPSLITDLEIPLDVSGTPEAWAKGLFNEFAELWPKLDLNVDLKLLDSRADHLGYRLVYQQVHQGLIVEGRTLSLWFDKQGRLKAIRQSLAPRPEGPPLPQIEVDEAEFIARTHGRTQFLLGDGSTRRLLFFPGHNLGTQGRAPKLAWEIHPWPHETHISDLYYYVDAQSGTLLYWEDRTRHNAALNVFEQNPVVDDWQTVQTTLPVNLVGDGSALESDLVETLACIDKHQLTDIDSDYGIVSVHVCSIDALATADNNGNFLYEPDYLSAQDPFAEGSAFYHTHKAIQFMAELGFEQLSTLPIQVLVNFQNLDGKDLDNMSDPYGWLLPITNAYYTGGSVPGETGSHPPRLQFCQGTEKDLAYDGDVVYHEFGHGVIASLNGPRRSSIGPYGQHNESSALNEGYADYLAAIMTEDPIFADYGAYQPDRESNGWRDLTNTKNCQDDIFGSSHGDGTIWSGALWTVRSQLPSDLHVQYDQSVFEAVYALGAYDRFAEASAMTASFLEAELGLEVAELFRQEAQGRYLHDCHRWQPMDGGTTSLGATGLSGVSVTGPAPGTFQIYIDVEASDSDLVLRGHQSQANASRLHYGGYAKDPNPHLRLLARRDTPISYVETPGIALGLYDHDVPFVETGEVYESTYSLYPEYEARIPIHSPGRYFLMAGSNASNGGSIIWLEATIEEQQSPVTDSSGRVTLAKTHARCTLNPDSKNNKLSPWLFLMLGLLSVRLVSFRPLPTGHRSKCH